jgi:muramidase (phage lysozyme)
MTDGLETLGFEKMGPAGFETTDGEMFGASFSADAIASNYWWLRERRTREHALDTAAAMSEALYGSPDAWMRDARIVAAGGLMPLPAPGEEDRAMRRMLDDMARVQTTMPGEFANFPASLADMSAQAEATARRELQEEADAADGLLSNRTAPNLRGGIASFAGSALAAGTDAETLPFLFVGASAQAGLARAMLYESLGAGLGAAAQAPAQQRQAEFLDREAPDPVANILAGAAFGAALPLAGRAVRLGANSLTEAGRIENRELLGWASRPGASDADRGAAAALAREDAAEAIALPGSEGLSHAARLDAAETALDSDGPMMVDTEGLIPEVADDPADAAPLRPDPSLPPDEDPAVRNIARLIAGVEAQGYDTIYSGSAIDTPRPLTQMTVAEVRAWQDESVAAGSASSAVGQFQIIRDTLDSLIDELDLTGDELFDEALQTRLGIALMRRRGLDDWRAGRISDEAFANELAREWAGLPVVSGPGAGGSYYAGDGLNGAGTTVDTVLAVLAGQRTPDRLPRSGSGFRGGTGGGPRRPIGDDANAAGIFDFDPRTILTDAATYQYKLGGDAEGVTPRLLSETLWHPRAAAGVLVHERLDGTRYIADGHQRRGLAMRLIEAGQEGITLQGFLLREADGWTPPMVRAEAALNNLKAETGTIIDAAKVLRDQPELARMIGNRARTFLQQATDLSALSPGPFQAVVNEVVPAPWGAIVGRLIPENSRLQGTAIATLNKAEPQNATQAEVIVREVRRTAFEAQAADAQGNLFGAFDLKQTTLRERARLIDRLARDARTDRALFGRLTRDADTIEEAGNALARDQNEARAAAAERFVANLLLRADEPGPLRDAIDAAARAIREGTDIATAAAQVRRAVLDPDGPAGREGAGAGPADGSPAGADLTQPNLLDLPPDGGGAALPGLFDDPVTDAATLAGLRADEATLQARLSDPAFDLDLPLTGTGPNGETAPAVSLRQTMQDLTDDADFVDALKTLCLPKGP